MPLNEVYFSVNEEKTIRINKFDREFRNRVQWLHLYQSKQVVKGIHLSRTMPYARYVPIHIMLKYFMQLQFMSILSFQQNGKKKYIYM